MKVTGRCVRIYLLAKSSKGKQEGIIKLCKPSKDKTRFVVDPQHEIHFDYLDDIPTKIRQLFVDAGETLP